MALLFMDGFDAGDTPQKWSSVVSGSTSTDTRFSSGRSWYIANTSNSITKSFTPSSQVFIGFAVKFNNYGSSRCILISGDNGSTQHLYVEFPSSTTISVTRGVGTTIATGSLPYPLTWGTYLEISAVISDTVGECQIRANGVTVLNYSGDTRNGGTSTDLDTVTVSKFVTSSPSIYIDDFYICNSLGSAPYNDFLGDVRVHTLTPDTAGASTQFTPSSGANYSTVDELPYSTADYVYGTTGQKDTYSTSNLPGGTGIIYGVQTNAIVRKTDAGNISGRPVVRASGTDYPGSAVSVGTSDVTLSKLDQVNPATSTAWTSGDVNGMEIGVESL